MSVNICIIGAGLASTAILVNLIKAVEQQKLGHVSIDVFEKSSRFGPGLAYRYESNMLLLNRTTRRMFVTEKGDFLAWINQQQFVELDYPIDDTYLPRHYFGKFLSWLFQHSKVRAKQLNCDVNLLNSTVTDMRREGQKMCLLSCEGDYFEYDHIFSCVGNDTKADPYDLIGTSGYYSNPYPANQFNALKKGVKVALIGTRLTAVDLAIQISEMQPDAEITMLSRNSGLPSKAGLAFHIIELTYFNEQNIAKLAQPGEPISLKAVARLLNQDLQAAGIKLGIFGLFNGARNQVFDGDEEQVRNMREVLLAASESISFVWKRLSEADRNLFFKRYAEAWVLLRLTMPGSSDGRIRQLIQTGKLEVSSGLKDINHDVEKGYRVGYQNGQESWFDVVINCTGIKRHCDKLSQSLIHSMVDQGLCTIHPFGGVRIDPKTNFSISADSKINPNLSIIGQLSVGEYFMVNSVDVLLLQSHIVVNAFIAKTNSAKVYNQPSVFVQTFDEALLTG